jgi:hypothetical protein
VTTERRSRAGKRVGRRDVANCLLSGILKENENRRDDVDETAPMDACAACMSTMNGGTLGARRTRAFV